MEPFCRVEKETMRSNVCNWIVAFVRLLAHDPQVVRVVHQVVRKISARYISYIQVSISEFLECGSVIVVVVVALDVER